MNKLQPTPEQVCNWRSVFEASLKPHEIALRGPKGAYAFGLQEKWQGYLNAMTETLTQDKLKPAAWVCFEADGQPAFCAGWESACHEHINDAIENGILEACTWVVRPVYANLNTNQSRKVPA